MLKLKPLFLMLGTLGVFGFSSAWAGDISSETDKKHDTSSPLGVLGHASLKGSFKNPVSILNATVPVKGFQGIGAGLGDYAVTQTRANTAGSVGLNQYVQWVNQDIAIFDKKTGQLAPGFPKPVSSLWSGFGPECEGSSVGRPIVKYDQIAHRWVLVQFTYDDIDRGPYYQCVAVSTSEDATGTYYRYAFQVDSFNDYGKLGLWRDGYYVAFNVSGRINNGSRICALDRDKMLVGAGASMQCKQFGEDETALLLPADLDGKTLPANGTPEYFMALDAPDQITLFKFHADFVDPTNAVVSSAISIPVASFSKACPASAGNECAIQPETDNKLDLLTDRLLRRLAFRQFSTYGALVVNHTVEGPPPKFAPAIRWYEFRVKNVENPNANPIVYQQATQAPDSKNRFVGSMASDRFGNMALGYNVTSSLIYPSIELSGRNYYGPLNTLAIQALVTGRGSQVDSVHDWAAFSAMSVDPSDDCTFWYTNEYLKGTGSRNWSTYIVYFKLAACS